MPFSSIHKFNDFNEFHHAANGLVRSAHHEIHIFRFEDIGKQVVKNMPLFRTSFYQIGLMRNAKFNIVAEKLFSSRKAEITYQFKKLIQNNLRTSKNVTEYADILHISPKYLIEVVSDVTNQSPKELINEQIILEVRTLLKYSDYPISDIAAAYHFTDQAHFANFFKKATTFTPLEYRNMHRSDFKKQ